MKSRQHQDIVKTIKIVVFKRVITPTKTLLEQHWDTFRQVTSCYHTETKYTNLLHIHNVSLPKTNQISLYNNDNTRVPYIDDSNKDTTPATITISLSNNNITPVQYFIGNIQDTQRSHTPLPVQNPLNALPHVQQLVDKSNISNTVSPLEHASPSNFIPYDDPIPIVNNLSLSTPGYNDQDETNNGFHHDDNDSTPHSHNIHDDTDISNISVNDVLITWIQWYNISTLPENSDNWTCPDNIDSNYNTCIAPDQYDIEIEQHLLSIDLNRTIPSSNTPNDIQTILSSNLLHHYMLELH